MAHGVLSISVYCLTDQFSRDTAGQARTLKNELPWVAEAGLSAGRMTFPSPNQRLKTLNSNMWKWQWTESPIHTAIIKGSK